MGLKISQLGGSPLTLMAGGNVPSLQGHESTCLLAQFPEKPATKDWVIVKVLKAQGAIPFVQTNIPQTLLRSLKRASWNLGWDKPRAETAL